MIEHVDLETLAALAEGSLARDAAAAVRTHLATCRSCTAAYADAVRYRAAWLARPEAFEASAGEARRLARALGPDLTGAWRPRRSAPTWLAAAAGVVLVAGAVAWFAWRGDGDARGLVLPPAVRAAVEASSVHGLVLPGGERPVARTTTEMRSGAAEPSSDLDREVTALLESYERGARSADDAARVVAALLAVSDLEGAGAYAREGLARHPDDVRLLVLHAVTLDRGNEPGAAEGLLREAHRRAPGDPLAALDLALVLQRRGADGEAHALFARVARSRVPALADRARRELADAR